MSPSYRIVFYVSGHGFGHTSRTVEVIRGVLRSRPDADVIVKTSAPRHLYDGPLGHQITVIDLECDAGMIQVDSLDLDIAESLRHAKQFQAQLPQLVHDEAAFLRDRGVRLVVGDIPPLAFAAADRAGVPSVAIGNFTWDWIYEAYPEESPAALVDDIREMYRLARTVLRLPLTGGFQGLESVARDIPFIARQSQRTGDEVRDALGLAARGHAKPVVLISFGRYGIQGFAAGSVAALSDYTVISFALPMSWSRSQDTASSAKRLQTTPPFSTPRAAAFASTKSSSARCPVTCARSSSKRTICYERTGPRRWNSC